MRPKVTWVPLDNVGYYDNGSMRMVEPTLGGYANKVTSIKSMVHGTSASNFDNQTVAAAIDDFVIDRIVGRIWMTMEPNPDRTIPGGPPNPDFVWHEFGIAVMEEDNSQSLVDSWSPADMAGSEGSNRFMWKQEVMTCHSLLVDSLAGTAPPSRGPLSFSTYGAAGKPDLLFLDIKPKRRIRMNTGLYISWTMVQQRSSGLGAITNPDAFVSYPHLRILGHQVRGKRR